jgi:hypothetical protein
VCWVRQSRKRGIPYLSRRKVVVVVVLFRFVPPDRIVKRCFDNKGPWMAIGMSLDVGAYTLNLSIMRYLVPNWVHFYPIMRWTGEFNFGRKVSPGSGQPPLLNPGVG